MFFKKEIGKLSKKFFLLNEYNKCLEGIVKLEISIDFLAEMNAFDVIQENGTTKKDKDGKIVPCDLLVGQVIKDNQKELDKGRTKLNSIEALIKAEDKKWLN